MSNVIFFLVGVITGCFLFAIYFTHRLRMCLISSSTSPIEDETEEVTEDA